MGLVWFPLGRPIPALRNMENSMKVKKPIPRDPWLYPAKFGPEPMNVFYDHIDPRRRQEVSDSRMIQEDHDAVANLSPRFIHKEFNQLKFDIHNTAANPQPWLDDEIEPY
jgi:hypothetical protein